MGRHSPENAVCAAGSQQSPLNLTGGVQADLPPLQIGWKKDGGTVVNNGHTIQVAVPAGSMLRLGTANYELVQYHSMPQASIA